MRGRSKWMVALVATACLAAAGAGCSNSPSGGEPGGDGAGAAGDGQGAVDSGDVAALDAHGGSKGGDAADAAVTGADGAAPVDTTVGSDGTGDGAAAGDAGGADGDAPKACNPPCEPPQVCVSGVCGEPAAGGCTPGEVQGCATDYAQRVCDPSGTAWVPAACPAQSLCVDGACKDVVCVPGKVYCHSPTATKVCRDDGQGFEDPVECAEGQVCQDGICRISCESDFKLGAYVGCEFWSTDLPNYPDPFGKNGGQTPEDLPYALVVANPGFLDAAVLFEASPGYTVDVADNTVPAGESRLFFMPTMNVQGNGIFERSVHVTSTVPVLVYQFNPWNNVWSNDASLLLPVPVVGKEYVVLTWPSSPIGAAGIPGVDLPSQNGYFTVLALHDGTNVTVKSAGKVLGGGDVPPMEPGDTQTFTLDRGQVLNIESDTDNIFGTNESALDLSGSTVSADKPVIVWVGHEEAVIGDGCCADHLEEQLFPVSLLGTHYVGAKTKSRGGESDVWRVQAAEDNVTLTTDPVIAGLAGVTLAHKGDWVEAWTPDSFELTATGKVQVMQYTVSQEVTNQHIGDPAMMLAVPVERFRDSYVIQVPPDYAENWASIIAPSDAFVAVDGKQVDPSAFQPVGSSGQWAVAWVALDPGVHQLSGDKPFGAQIYGYNGAVCYGVAAGISIPDEPTSP